MRHFWSLSRERDYKTRAFVSDRSQRLSSNDFPDLPAKSTVYRLDPFRLPCRYVSALSLWIHRWLVTLRFSFINLGPRFNDNSWRHQNQDRRWLKWEHWGKGWSGKEFVSASWIHHRTTSIIVSKFGMNWKWSIRNTLLRNLKWISTLPCRTVKPSRANRGKQRRMKLHWALGSWQALEMSCFVHCFVQLI